MKKYIPVFGPQELFDTARDNHSFAIQTRHGIYFYIEASTAIKAATGLNKDDFIQLAQRCIEETQHPDTSEKEIEDLISDRDRWESKATELAHGIAEKFGTDFGEHSSANCPVQNAIDFVFDLESTERIINEPNRWTVADQKAGRLPEVGAKFKIDGDLLLPSCNDRNITVTARYRKDNAYCVETESGELWIAGDISPSQIKPIETPAEKAQRLKNEWIESANKVFKGTMVPDDLSDIYDAMLSGELKAPEVE